ncbi:MAG: small ribosomal subunit Rsm22 family protein [Myxococcota bacterium]|nr:small ribosomal subunit Rsm22 family protein [Myxococcota bacterium]MDW8363281.1 small ribosomal subunit Rsm22 family protein [Myxococcales bacterium]
MSRAAPPPLERLAEIAFASALERLRDAGLDPSLGRLASTVAALSDVYTRRRERIGRDSRGAEAIAARLAFYAPRDALKIDEVLEELDAAGALPRDGDRWRVLDVGAGVGASLAGVLVRAHVRGRPRAIEATAVDADPRALDAGAELLARFARESGVVLNLSTRISDVRRLRDPDPDAEAGFDLVLTANVLNELPRADRMPLLRDLLRRLAPDGLLLVLEPGLRETTRELMAMRDALVESGAPLHVAGPCTHARPCPMLPSPRDWCHARLRGRLPTRTASLARMAGLAEQGAAYAWLALRSVPGSVALLGSWRAVSEPLRAKGKTELWACGEPGLVRLRQLDRHRGSAADLAGLERGVLFDLEPDPSGPVQAGAQRARLTTRDADADPDDAR